MALFRREKKDKAKVPAEVQKYYDSEHREKVGLAWLVAFGSLLVTVLLILAIFFGGRWIYRKVNHNNKQATTTQTDNKAASKATPGPNNTSSTNESKSESPSTSSDNNSSSDQSASNSGESSTSSSSTSSNTPVNDLVNTGPGDTLAIFLAVTALGTLLHAGYTKHKAKNL